MRDPWRLAALELLLPLVLLLASGPHKATAFANWRAIECSHLDTVYATVQCNVKPLRRNVAALNVYVTLIRRPITEFRVRVEFKKRANGWKPFLYSFSVDACQFLATKKKNPVVNFFYEYLGVASHSNLNHSCPFDNDVFLANHTFPATVEATQKLPLPSGYYGVFTTWSAGGKPRLKINGFFSVVDD